MWGTTSNGDNLMPTPNEIATLLRRCAVAYTWRKLEVGPNYTAEYRPVCDGNHYEVQSKHGAHIGRYPGLEEAIIAVMDLDPAVTIPQDLSRIK